MIKQEEIKALKKMKMKEAAGIDGILMEEICKAWRYAKEEFWIRLIDLRVIWKRGTLPKDWWKGWAPIAHIADWLI